MDTNAFFYLYSSGKDYTKHQFNDVSRLIFTEFSQLKSIGEIQLDYVIHLGEDTPIMLESWDQVNQANLIEDSRKLNVDLREFLQLQNKFPKRLLFASSIDHYGFQNTPHDRDACINFKYTFRSNESFMSGLNRTFLNRYTQQKETFAYLMQGAGIQTVVLRFGFILDRSFTDMGHYVDLMDKCRIRSIGSGYQPLNWIHVDDAVASVLHLLVADLRDVEQKVFNIVASASESKMTTFSDLGFCLSCIRKRKYYFKMPEGVALALFGEKVLKYSQGHSVYSINLPKVGFEPKFKRLIDALYDLCCPI